jgi:hypothetical protein
MQPGQEDAEKSNEGNPDELSRLLVPGTIGFYNFFEVTEIIAFPGAAKEPINVLTLAVAEETAQVIAECRFLNTDRIELGRLKG